MLLETAGTVCLPPPPVNGTISMGENRGPCSPVQYILCAFCITVEMNFSQHQIGDRVNRLKFFPHSIEREKLFIMEESQQICRNLNTDMLLGGERGGGGWKRPYR